MYDVHGFYTPSRCVSTLIHGWLGSRGQPRLATNFWTRSWFAAADGWTRLPRKGTRWPPGNVRSWTLADAYGRLPTLIPGAWLLLLPRVTVSNRTPVWLGLYHAYGRSLTGTDEWRRSDAIAKLGDGVCTLTARPDRMPTRRDGLPTHRDGVCTQKCDNPHPCLYVFLKAARTWLFPLGLYMLVRVLVSMFHTGLFNILF